MFKKFKQNIKKFMTGKSGFSLVELIVVIAIMAVMAAVLAPALLGYVEKSRMQKDSSAMGEVTNAIQLSIADQNVYDELLPYTVKGNFSCYADGDASTNTDANKIITKSPDYWLFNDECRKLDETPYQPAGSMRGVTITLKPNGSAEYILKDGIINQTGDSSTAKGTITGKTLNDAPEVYNRLRSTVGDTIKVSSQTYRNSTYTIFVSMGTTGGNQAEQQDAIQVYGQYNGTNLPEVMTATGAGSQDKGNAGSNGSINPDGENLNHKNVIPANAYYLSNNSGLLGEGDSFPEAIAGDIYAYEDYYYTYNGTGWAVTLRTSDMHMLAATTDKQQTSYSTILESINNIYVVSLMNTFTNCTQLEIAPRIPSHVTTIQQLYNNCSKLRTYEGSSSENGDFSGYIIPSSVTDMNSTFNDCSLITKAPTIPQNITRIDYCFKGCSQLTGTLIMDATPTLYTGMLRSSTISAIKTSNGETNSMASALLATR